MIPRLYDFCTGERIEFGPTNFCERVSALYGGDWVTAERDWTRLISKSLRNIDSNSRDVRLREALKLAMEAMTSLEGPP